MSTKPVLKVLIIYICGLILGKYFDFPAPLILFICIFPLIVAFILWYTDKGHHHVKEGCLAVSLIFIAIVHYELATGYYPSNHISNFTNQNESIAISGIIVKFPEPRLKKISLTMAVNDIFMNHEVVSAQGKILVNVPKFASMFQYGDEILVRGMLRKPRDRRNPGEFDSQAFFQSQNIFGILSVDKKAEIKKISSGHGNWILRNWLFSVKNYLNEFIGSHFPSKEATFLQGLIIGQRGEISITLREAFSNLGVIHVLAVSGLHVGFIILTFMGVFGFLRIPYRYRILLTILGLVFYAFLVNLKPPVVRASIMGGLLLTGTLLERKTDVYNSLALAALVILIFNPLELFQAGFQLSFTAVISIVYLYPKIKAFFSTHPKIHNIQKIAGIHYVVELLFVSMAAFLGTLPFTIIYFNRIPNFAIFANLLIIPLVFCGFACGIIASVVNLFVPFLGKIYIAATWFFLHVIIEIIEWANQFMFTHYETYKFLFPQALAYFIGMILISNLNHERVRRWLVIFFLILTNVFVWQAATKEKNVLKVIFFDVGQGDAALLTFPDDKHVLVDGGPRGINYNAGKWVIAPYLKRERIHDLDALILSHGDADHLGGFPYIMRNFKVHEVWDNGQVQDTKLHQEYINLIDSLKITRRVLRAGENITDFKPVHIFTMHPTDRFLKHSNLSLNDGSLSLKISYGEVDFLFVGDIENKGEAQISTYGNLLESEVLKVGHHGSRTSSSQFFLNKVQPQIAVISASELNRFGHPHRKTLNRLRAAGAKIFRIDKHGAIILKTDGMEIEQINWK